MSGIRLAVLGLLIVGFWAAGPAGAAEAPPQLEARSWALIDARSGDVLASHAASERLPIASTTKMMTAYVALQELPLGKIVTVAPYDAIFGESLLEVPAGAADQRSRSSLRADPAQRQRRRLRPCPCRSRLGSRLRASDESRAAALGLVGHSLREPDRPRRGGQLLERPRPRRRWRAGCCAIPAFAKIAASRSAELRSLRPPRQIETINDFLLAEPWATGVKTGHTFGADYVLVGSGRRKGVELISAVLGAWTDVSARSARPSGCSSTASPSTASGSRSTPGRGSRRSRRSATRATSCRCARRGPWRSACGEASG